MHKRWIAMGLMVALWIALLPACCSAVAAEAELTAEPWFMDFFDYQAQSFITDPGAVSLYRHLMAEACTAPGKRDMTVFLDEFLKLPREQQERMIAGAKVKKLMDALFVWEDFLQAAHGRLSEVEQLPFLREVFAPERAALLAGEAVWTYDALSLYHGDVGEPDAWTFTPASPETGAFLFMTETGGEPLAQVEELTGHIEDLSGDALRHTQDPDQATAILVYGSGSSPRGSYTAYEKKVTAYAATVRLQASVLAMPEEPPLYISFANEPPAQAELDEEQRVYYPGPPSLLDAPKLPWLVEELTLMLLHPEEYRATLSSLE